MTFYPFILLESNVMHTPVPRHTAHRMQAWGAQLLGTESWTHKLGPLLK